MLETIWSLTPSDKAAWYGAIIATVALIWQIVRELRAGPRLQGSSSTNMKFMPTMGREDNTTNIVLTVFNIGDRSTTLTHVAIEYYPSWWAWRRDKATRGFIVPSPSPAQPIPFKLSPGERWIGFAKETPEVIDLMNSGRLAGTIYFDGKKKLRIRISAKPEQLGQAREQTDQRENLRTANSTLS